MCHSTGLICSAPSAPPDHRLVAPSIYRSHSINVFLNHAQIYRQPLPPFLGGPFFLGFTLPLRESHTHTICICSDGASLNSTSPMIDYTKAFESGGLIQVFRSSKLPRIARVERECAQGPHVRHAPSSSRWRRQPARFNGVATIIFFKMPSGLICRST